jgi:hypothetical protein
MRVTRIGASRLATLAFVAVVVAMTVVLFGVHRSRSSSPTAATSIAVTANDSGHKPRLKADTKRVLGSFELRKGRTSRVSTADTVDGLGCLIEEDNGGEMSSCLEGGLFSARKAELVVSSQGGPDRFSELHVVGIAAPSIRGVWMVKTDGTTVQLPLNAQRAFVFESSAEDLDAKVYPTSLRLHGQSGRLVETVDFPPAG